MMIAFDAAASDTSASEIVPIFACIIFTLISSFDILFNEPLKASIEP